MYGTYQVDLISQHEESGDRASADWIIRSDLIIISFYSLEADVLLDSKQSHQYRIDFETSWLSSLKVM